MAAYVPIIIPLYHQTCHQTWLAGKYPMKNTSYTHLYPIDDFLSSLPWLVRGCFIANSMDSSRMFSLIDVSLRIPITHMLNGAAILPTNWVFQTGQMLVNIPAPWSIWVIHIVPIIIPKKWLVYTPLPLFRATWVLAGRLPSSAVPSVNCLDQPTVIVLTVCIDAFVGYLYIYIHIIAYTNVNTYIQLLYIRIYTYIYIHNQKCSRIYRKRMKKWSLSRGQWLKHCNMTFLVDTEATSKQHQAASVTEEWLFEDATTMFAWENHNSFLHLMKMKPCSSHHLK